MHRIINTTKSNTKKKNQMNITASYILYYYNTKVITNYNN